MCVCSRWLIIKRVYGMPLVEMYVTWMYGDNLGAPCQNNTTACGTIATCVGVLVALHFV